MPAACHSTATHDGSRLAGRSNDESALTDNSCSQIIRLYPMHGSGRKASRGGLARRRHAETPPRERSHRAAPSPRPPAPAARPALPACPQDSALESLKEAGDDLGAYVGKRSISSAKTVECVPWVPAIQGQEMIRATRVPSSKLVCFVHSLCLQQQQGRSVMVSCALLWNSAGQQRSSAQISTAKVLYCKACKTEVSLQSKAGCKRAGVRAALTRRAGIHGRPSARPRSRRRSPAPQPRPGHGRPGCPSTKPARPPQHRLVNS